MVESSYEAVIFDMDGLMLETEPLYKSAWQDSAARLGFSLEDELYASVIGRNETDSEQLLVSTFGPGFPIERFRDLWTSQWRSTVANDGIALKPGLIELLEFLDQNRIPRAVATSSFAAEANISLKASGLDERFSVVVTGDQIENGKPAPDIYLAAAERIDVTPGNCVALEDSNAGLLAASAADMTALMIPDLKEPAPEAVRAALAILPSLKEAKELIEQLF